MSAMTKFHPGGDQHETIIDIKKNTRLHLLVYITVVTNWTCVEADTRPQRSIRTEPSMLHYSCNPAG